jgi:HD-GYP domain-containing protein (c-di-GMP phosphodiesterase class II)
VRKDATPSDPLPLRIPPPFLPFFEVLPLPLARPRTIKMVEKLKKFFQGISLKLALVSLVLILFVTTLSSLVVIRLVDNFLLRELVHRGRAISLSAATPAGYSILAGERLALDNLAVKIKESQPDLVYLAIVDLNGTVLAHNELALVGTTFQQRMGRPVDAAEGAQVSLVERSGEENYTFRTPIEFAGRRVGDVYLGIDAATLQHSRRAARLQLFLVSTLLVFLGVGGAFLLSGFITNPVKRLARGVSTIKNGGYGVTIEVTSHDELGELTRNFNEMSQMILEQRENLESTARDLERSSLSTVRILAAAIDARDQYTFGHSARVARLSLRIGSELGLEDDQLTDLEMACFLHDVGKIRVPDLILNKEGPLDDREYQLVRCHPDQGAEILSIAESLHKYIPVVLHHHEWYDGSGYPAGLKGEDIPLYAQIVALADSYDAITTSRPYRPGASREAAIAEICEFRGTQFSPVLTDLFSDILVGYQHDEELSFMVRAV